MFAGPQFLISWDVLGRNNLAGLDASDLPYLISLDLFCLTVLI